MFNVSQLMAVGTFLALTILVAGVVLVSAGVIVTVIAVHKSRINKGDKTKVEEVKKEVEEEKKEVKEEKKEVKEQKKTVKSNKEDLTGEETVEDQDFKKDSKYPWVYKITYTTKDHTNDATFSWKTDDNASMKKALSRDGDMCSYVSYMCDAETINIKVKYLDKKNTTQYFEKQYIVKEELLLADKIKGDITGITNNFGENKQKEEAIKRMKMLKIMPQVIEDFEKNNRVYYSERLDSIFCATLYWLDNHKEYVELVKEFEKKHKALVYHAQLTHFEFSDCLALFYVSKEETEWERDRKDITNGEMFCYVANLNDEFCSDYGYIGIRPAYGGVARTY